MSNKSGDNCWNGNNALRKVYSQSNYPVYKTIHGKLSMRSLGRKQEFNISYPSLIADAYFIPKLLSLRDTVNVYEYSSYDLRYFINEEVLEVIPAKYCYKFINRNGHIIKLNQDQTNYLMDLIYCDEVSYLSVGESLRNYSLVMAEEMQQKKIKKYLEILSKELLAVNPSKNVPTVPPIPNYQFVVPTTMIILKDILFGIDVRSKDHDKGGRLKVFMSTCAYDIVRGDILGQENVLQQLYELDFHELVDELKSHDIDYAELQTPDPYQGPSVLRKEKAKTAKLRNKLDEMELILNHRAYAARGRQNDDNE